MAVLIPPPPNAVADFDHQWKDWLFTMWRRVKGLEPGETDGGDSNAFHDNVDGEFFTLGGLGVGVDADLIVLEDASDGYSKVGMTLLNFRRLEDNIKWTYGTGDDASIYYNATDLIIDPKEVGTGTVRILGDVQQDDNDGAIFGTGDDAKVYYDATNLVINPKVAGSGILDILGTVRSDGRIEEINTTAKTANYTATATDENILCDTSGGAFTITLPAAPENGRVYTVILETAGNVLTIAGAGKLLLGASTMTLSNAGNAAQLIYNGTQWSLK